MLMRGRMNICANLIGGIGSDTSRARVRNIPPDALANAIGNNLKTLLRFGEVSRTENPPRYLSDDRT